MKDYPMLNQAVASVLKAQREAKSVSKRKLAELAQFERVYLIQLEKGEKRPTVNALFLISEALGLKPSRFLEMVEEELERMKSGKRSI